MNFWKPPSTAGLEKARVDALAVLENLDPIQDATDYNKAMDQVVKLSENIAKERNTSPQLDPNTFILAGANILGILMIVKHEHVNLITSKALGFIGKTR